MRVAVSDSTRDRVWMAAAAAAALSGPVRRCRHGAVLVKHRRVIAAAYNSNGKTDPKVLRFMPWGVPHAEMAVVVRAGIDNCSGATLYVTRVMGDGSFGISEPCPSCTKLLDTLDLRAIVFTDGAGAFWRSK